MTAQNYARALTRVLVHEGGYANHPADPGGATMQGVTQRVYDAYRGRRGDGRRSVRLIEHAELKVIYRRQYWDIVKGDALPAGVDYAVFDGAVNSGPEQAVKWLQRALGSLKVDGVVGEATLAAVETYPDHDRLIALMLGRRLAFLEALRTWSTFGRGWKARVAQVKKIGQAWATGSVGPNPSFVEGGDAKATIDQAKPASSPAAGDVAVGAGLATGGAGGALQQAQEALTPLAGSGGWIDSAIAALALTGALITVGGIAWRFYARRKAAQETDALDLAVPA